MKIYFFYFLINLIPILDVKGDSTTLKTTSPLINILRKRANICNGNDCNNSNFVFNSVISPNDLAEASQNLHSQSPTVNKTMFTGQPSAQKNVLPIKFNGDSICNSPTACNRMNINSGASVEQKRPINFPGNAANNRDNIFLGTNAAGKDCDANGQRCNIFAGSGLSQPSQIDSRNNIFLFGGAAPLPTGSRDNIFVLPEGSLAPQRNPKTQQQPQQPQGPLQPQQPQQPQGPLQPQQPQQPQGPIQPQQPQQPQGPLQPQQPQQPQRPLQPQQPQQPPNPNVGPIDNRDNLFLGTGLVGKDCDASGQRCNVFQ